MSVLDGCYMINLGVVQDERGSLVFVENNATILPFECRRFYYLYDLKKDIARGAHAHKALQQVIIAISGSFTVTLKTPEETRQIELASPAQGLYIAPGAWRELGNFSGGAVVLAITSLPYDEDDYIRDYSAYCRYFQEVYSD